MTETPSLNKLPLRLLVTSWNVGNQPPRVSQLASWIPKNGKGYDMIAVACQEATYKMKSKSRMNVVEAKLEEEEEEAAIAAAAAAAAPEAPEAPEAVPSTNPTEEPSPNSSTSPDVTPLEMPGVPTAMPVVEGQAESKGAESSPSKAPKEADNALDLGDINVVQVEEKVVEETKKDGGPKPEDQKQEISPKDVIHDVTKLPFYRSMSDHLGDDWKIIDGVVLWQIGLVVFIRTGFLSEHDLAVSNNCALTEATGFMHVSPNKGGCAVAFQIGNTSLVFIGAHLAAHNHFLKRRNRDMREILKGIRLPSAAAPGCFDSRVHHVIWAGDLNYRIEVPNAETLEEQNLKVAELIKGKQWKELQKMDQLKQSIRDNRAFHGYQEPEVFNFPPTFKIKSFNGDSPVYNQKRVPSYCDRILWKSLPGFAQDLECKGLEWCPKIQTSDHIPVRASFTLQCSLEPPRPNAPIARRHDVLYEKLHLLKVKASDLLAMDMNGLSDPYILFELESATRPALHGPMERTQVMNRTKNPEWSSSQLPRPFPLFFSNTETHLLLHFYDRDRFSKDDYMGSAVFSLAEFNKDEPRSFTAPVVLYGRQHGSVEVTAQITCVEEAGAVAEKPKGCCTIM